MPTASLVFLETSTSPSSHNDTINSEVNVGESQPNSSSAANHHSSTNTMVGGNDNNTAATSATNPSSNNTTSGEQHNVTTSDNAAPAAATLIIAQKPKGNKQQTASNKTKKKNNNNKQFVYAKDSDHDGAQEHPAFLLEDGQVDNNGYVLVQWATTGGTARIPKSWVSKEISSRRRTKNSSSRVQCSTSSSTSKSDHTEKEDGGGDRKLSSSSAEQHIANESLTTSSMSTDQQHKRRRKVVFDVERASSSNNRKVVFDLERAPSSSLSTSGASIPTSTAIASSSAGLSSGGINSGKWQQHAKESSKEELEQKDVSQLNDFNGLESELDEAKTKVAVEHSNFVDSGNGNGNAASLLQNVSSNTTVYAEKSTSRPSSLEGVTSTSPSEGGTVYKILPAELPKELSKGTIVKCCMASC